MNFSKEFRELCQKNSVEPIIDPKGQLMLICPKIPSQEIQDKIKASIPDSSPTFIPALRTVTRAMVGILLAQYGATGLGFMHDGRGAVVIDVQGDANRTALKPENPHVWGEISKLVKADPYTQKFLIAFNGTPIASSEKSLEDFVNG